MLTGKQREYDIHSVETLDESDLFQQVQNMHVALVTYDEKPTSTQNVNIVTHDDFIMQWPTSFEF